MDQRKKSLITVICISVLIILGIVNISFINYRERGNYPWLKMIIIGTSAGPHTLDPMNSSDHASNDVLDQIFEGLFTYNLSDHNLPRINLLAESYHWVNTTTFQIKLRKGIFFHDGYPLNSTAAKWSFDRLNYMCNASNEANRMIPFNIPNTGSIGAPASMYFLPNGDPIIDEVDAVGEYNITFHLNSPF
ncbi:MAG: ABC transporter substrate-binding protein, partial [Candidatus Lokiarchaeota archaeon]